MRRSLLLFSTLAFSFGPLMAGGEYDAFHAGPRLGLTWSPDKSYGGLGSAAPGTTTVAEGQMQIGLTGGLSFDYAVVPGTLDIGLIGDFIRTIHKEAPKGAPGVKQNITREELRFTYNGRGNVNEGMGFWLSPTLSQIHTSLGSAGDLSEHRAGGALGIVSHHFHETYLSSWEVGAYYLPKLKSGTEAGSLTIELRVGYQF